MGGKQTARTCFLELAIMVYSQLASSWHFQAAPISPVACLPIHEKNTGVTKSGGRGSSKSRARVSQPRIGLFCSVSMLGAPCLVQWLPGGRSPIGPQCTDIRATSFDCQRHLGLGVTRFLCLPIPAEGFEMIPWPARSSRKNVKEDSMW